jgi:hypothetical protein
MKCVKNTNTNEVKRVSNETANRLVAAGSYAFCPKSEWKALRPKDFVNPETLAPRLSQEEKAQRQSSKKDAYKAQKRAARFGK